MWGRHQSRTIIEGMPYNYAELGVQSTTTEQDVRAVVRLVVPIEASHQGVKVRVRVRVRVTGLCPNHSH